ncbi:hypothetical protein COOFOMLJ_01939 [Aeromonas veronii]
MYWYHYSNRTENNHWYWNRNFISFYSLCPELQPSYGLANRLLQRDYIQTDILASKVDKKKSEIVFS